MATPTAAVPSKSLSAREATRTGVLGHVGAWCALLGIGALLAYAGWSLLFSTFMSYDDEGYVLISLRHFAAGGVLYDRLYTQYGPFFYLLADALRGLLRFEWNSTSGRLFALACWSGSAASCAALVARQTRSLASTALTLAATFGYLICNIYEPSHPGSLVGLFVAIAAWVGSEGEMAERPAAVAALGALGAALTFTKINVGGFLLIAATAWLVLHATWLGARRVAFAVLCLLLLALPWLLMRQLLSDAAVPLFAANTSLGMLGVLVAARSGARPTATPRVIAAFVLGAAGVSLATLGAISARGTSLSGLLHGVLIDPMRHPFVNYVPTRWLPGSAHAGGAAAILAVWACQEKRPIALTYVLGAVRLLAAITIAYFALTDPSALAGIGLSYGVSIAGLCALPMRADAAGVSDARARQWIALLLVLQSLHAFPTAGHQVGWGAFLIVPLVSLAVRDAWIAVLPERVLAARLVPIVSSLASVGLALAIAVHLLLGGLAHYREGDRLRLAGAERVSLAPQTVLVMRTLAENARAHASILFSAPGMYSFNLWSERPTPTLANATQWAALLKPEAQREIIARLSADPRAVVIRGSVFAGHGELYEYLQREFRPAFGFSGYIFEVHQGRRIAALSTARIRQADAQSMQLDLTLARVEQPITRIEMRQLDAPTPVIVFRLAQGAATLEATPLGSDGRSSGPARALDWPAELHDPITLLRVRFAGSLPPPGTLVTQVFSGERVIAAAATQIVP